MPVYIEGPAFPNHEGGIKFTVEIFSDCVLPAKDQFVSAHAEHYERVYDAESFDLAHFGRILDDDFCGVQSLSPPTLRLHRPRGVRHPPKVTIDGTWSHVSADDLDAIVGVHTGNVDISFFASVIVAVVLIAIVILLWPKERKIHRLQISKIPRTRNSPTNLNGTYMQLRGGSWRHTENAAFNIRLREGWEILDGSTVLATAAPVPSLTAVDSWMWADPRRRPRTFIAKFKIEDECDDE